MTPEQWNTVQMNTKKKAKKHREWVLKSQEFKVIHQGMQHKNKLAHKKKKKDKTHVREKQPSRAQKCH